MNTLIIATITVLSFLTSDFAQAQTQTDSVTVTFEVVVPKLTPKNATIFMATSDNIWDPGNQGTGFGQKDYSLPLELNHGTWTRTLTAKKGHKMPYKYTRGSVYSAEEQADYTYLPVRKVLFDHTKTVYDTVQAWHDIPPKALAKRWPTIQLKKTSINITRGDKLLKGSGTILYDKSKGSKFYDFNETNTDVKSVPDSFLKTVYYYLKISSFPKTVKLIAAAKTKADGPWHIFVDINNDQAITMNEQVMSLKSNKKQNKDSSSTAGPKKWSGNVAYQVKKNDKVSIDSVKLTLFHLTNLPKGYGSSADPDAPNLGYQLPFKERKGVINGHSFYISTPFPYSFRAYCRILIDRNQNDSLDMGSGSNEVYNYFDYGKIYHKQKYYLYPSFKLANQFWEVANIDPRGKWIRLRPAKKINVKHPITIGKPAPQWKAVTLNGKPINSKSLQGKYVLLDFWGSWCGPCRQEIPLLKKVYKRFHSQSFQMVGFALESKASLQKAMKRYHLPYPQVVDGQGKYSSKFLVRGYPTHYLIGPKGKVLEMDSALRGDQLVAALEKYLK